MKKEYFNIPNLMGYFRILMIPVFLVTYYRADTPKEFGISILILAITFLTDFFDGKIARKFNMITEFGKALDPFADKLMQGALTIAVTFHHSLMKLFLVVLIIKEFYMGIMGLYLTRKKKIVINGAKWYGKVCTGIFDIGIFFLLLFPKMPVQTSNIIVVIMLIAAILTLLKYIQFHRSLMKA